ncbi:Spo0B domain-containing protein [Desulfothermobacter acidiphilus]|uniref:Spo0B domain-containing protein n=1 Tax=Desulfothermobacter acidiphilus TaxID=1938353 RepID=UPI003F8B31C8
METEDALALLRAQYHIFANHLQVILGLLELGRVEQAREQITRAAKDIASQSQALKCGLPEVAWLLLWFQAQGLKIGLRVFLDLEPTPPFSLTPAQLDLLRRCHRLLLDSGRETELLVTGKSYPEGYWLHYLGNLNWEEVARELSSPQVNWGPETLTIKLSMGEK